MSNKVEISMNMLINFEEFFKKLKFLKDGKVEEIATVTFYKNLSNQVVQTRCYIDETFEILLNSFKEEIESNMNNILSIVDLTPYENELSTGNKYVLSRFYIKPDNEAFKVYFTLEDFAINCIFEDEFKPFGNSLSKLLDNIEKKTISMLDTYILNEDVK